jgi:hypothetical protein
MTATVRKRTRRETTGLRRTLAELRQTVARFEAHGKRFIETDQQAMTNWNLNDGGFLRVCYYDGVSVIERLNTYGVHVRTYRVKL